MIPESSLFYLQCYLFLVEAKKSSMSMRQVVEHLLLHSAIPRYKARVIFGDFEAPLLHGRWSGCGGLDTLVMGRPSWFRRDGTGAGSHGCPSVQWRRRLEWIIITVFTMESKMNQEIFEIFLG